MTEKMQPIAAGKKIAKLGCYYQLIFSAVIIAFTTWYFGPSMGISVALGCVTSFLPNVVFALFAFRYSGARQSQQVARSFSQGSKIKLAITIGFFVLAFAEFNAQPIGLFSAFIATTAVYWIALFRLRSP